MILWPPCKPLFDSTLVSGHPLAHRLAAAWLGGEAGGTRAIEATGAIDRYASLDLPFVGDTTFGPGRFGPAYKFDGSSCCMGRNVGSFMSLSGERTLVAWFKTGTKGRGLVSRYSNAGGYQYRLGLNASGCAYFAIAESNTANTKTITGTVDLADDRWHQVVGTYDLNHLYLYVDGVSAAIPVAATFTTPTAGYGFYIGAITYDGSAAGTWNGLIDHVLVYRRAMLAGEVALLYCEPFAMFRSEPIAPWATSLAPASTNVTVQPAALALSGSLQAPTVNYDHAHTASSLGISMTPQAALVNLSPVITPASLGISASLGTPTVSHDLAVSPPALSVAMTAPAPSANHDFMHAVEALALAVAQQGCTVNAQINVTVTAGPAGLNVTVQSPTPAYDFVQVMDDLSLALSSASPDVGVIVDRMVTPEAASLSLTWQSPSTNYDFVQVLSALSLALSEPSPSVGYDMAVAIAAALAMSAGLNDPSVSGALSMTVSVDALRLTVTVQTPQESYDYRLTIDQALALAAGTVDPTLLTGSGGALLLLLLQKSR